MVQPSPVKAEGKAEEILLPPPLKDITFYGALTPTTAQPFLAISGIGECKGYWIGALPVPHPRRPSLSLPQLVLAGVVPTGQAMGGGPRARQQACTSKPKEHN